MAESLGNPSWPGNKARTWCSMQSVRVVLLTLSRDCGEYPLELIHNKIGSLILDVFFVLGKGCAWTRFVSSSRSRQCGATKIHRAEIE